MLWGLVLLVILPRGVGELILGNLWRPTYPLVLPAALAVMAMCAITGASVGLHALGAARRSLRAAILTSVLLVSGALVGAATGGVLGTMVYGAIASWVGTLVYWWQFRMAVHESCTVHVPKWLWRSSSGRHRRPSAR